MPIITLTTDLGVKDYYVSVVKGALLTELPGVNIVDITHEIEPFNISQASFIIKNSFRSFPEGTVHIIGTNAQPSANVPFLGIKSLGHYFIGADDGIFSLIFDITPDLIVELNIKPNPDFYAFPLRDIFVKAAAHLARGGTLEIIGNRRENYVERTTFKPHTESNLIKGMITHVDGYENVITNITRQIFKETGKDRTYSINIRGNSVEELSRAYTDVPEGEMAAMFNSAGYLEIAINKGKASSLLNLKLGDMITIQFNDN